MEDPVDTVDGQVVKGIESKMSSDLIQRIKFWRVTAFRVQDKKTIHFASDREELHVLTH